MAETDHVSIQRLSKEFPQRRGESLVAIADLDLRVPAGEFLAIVGPSGCGKSTLLKTVGGLLEPDQGSVLIAGHPPKEAQRRRDLGFAFQDPALLPWRTVLDNVRLPIEVGGDRSAPLPDGHRTPSPQGLLDLMGLSAFAASYPHELSGGMQQRVAIARALALAPSLLLMDEPFGALDEITRSAMRYELLRIWQASAKTVLFVTHSIVEAVTLADRVAVMSGPPGRIKALVPIELPRPRHEEIERSPAFLDYTHQLRALLKE